MPITGVLDLQRRSRPLGEIRIGESVPVEGKNYRKPVRRKTFLFTTPVHETAEAIAAHPKIGGTVTPWERRDGYWAVDTDVAVLEVWVPPRGLAVDAWMEMWDGGKCKRRCDGITETRSGRPCMCPQPEDRTDPALVMQAANERKRLAGLTPPQACRPITRINVQIPGLPGVTGVWVMRTASANAAVETADTGEVLNRARDMDVYLPALALIHWRPGQDGHPYPVLGLQLRPSAEQVAQLQPGMDGMLAQLASGSGPLALTSGTPAAAPAEPGKTAGPHAATCPPEDERAELVTHIAELIPLAKTREDVEKLAKRAEKEGVAGETVWTTPEGEDAELGETLHDLLGARWKELPAASTPAARPAATSPADEGGGSLFDNDDPEWGSR